jgi:SPP1 family predicted phage head-tail adaptor
VQAGQLRNYITIESLAGTTADGFGNTRQVWTAVHSSVPASITPVSSREIFNADRAVSSFTHRIVIRYMPGITTAMRIKHGSRTFTIAGLVNGDERSISLELTCMEQVS